MGGPPGRRLDAVLPLLHQWRQGRCRGHDDGVDLYCRTRQRTPRRLPERLQAQVQASDDRPHGRCAGLRQHLAAGVFVVQRARRQFDRASIESCAGQHFTHLLRRGGHLRTPLHLERQARNHQNMLVMGKVSNGLVTFARSEGAKQSAVVKRKK